MIVRLRGPRHGWGCSAEQTVVKLMCGGTAELTGNEWTAGLAGDMGVVGSGGASAQRDTGDGGTTCDL